MVKRKNDATVRSCSVKLQAISREGKKNLLYSLHVPVSMVDELGWSKGDHLKLKIKKDNLVIDKLLEKV